MSIRISNEYLTLDIEEPGESYKGSRFDWTGKIIQITFKNKYRFCTSETLNDKFKNESGKGLFNEFGINQPVGYDECPPGAGFPKIGVGLLTRKSDKAYDFSSKYDILPYSFNIKEGTKSVEFTCKSAGGSNYEFRLNKKIELKEDSFSINYSLLNTGVKYIRTNEYVHNFISINGKKVDKRYRLELPFEIIPQNFDELLNPGNTFNISGKTLTWDTAPLEPFFIGRLNTWYRGKGKWTLLNSEDKAGISETTDFKILRMNLWGASHVLSPELFFEINLAPGKETLWKRKYSVFEL